MVMLSMKLFFMKALMYYYFILFFLFQGRETSPRVIDPYKCYETLCPDTPEINGSLNDSDCGGRESDDIIPDTESESVHGDHCTSPKRQRVESSDCSEYDNDPDFDPNSGSEVESGSSDDSTGPNCRAMQSNKVMKQMNYVPESDHDDVSSSSEVFPLQKLFKRQLLSQERVDKSNVDLTQKVFSQERVDESNVDLTRKVLSQGKPDESNVDSTSGYTLSSENLVTVQNSQEGKFWFCMYCNKEQKKLPRHLVTCHKNEDLVKKYEMASGEKNKLLTKIRNIGNHLHNVSVLEKGTGTLIVVHRPTDECASPGDYVPCSDCYGYYKKPLLYKHICPFQDKSVKKKATSKVKQDGKPFKRVQSLHL